MAVAGDARCLGRDEVAEAISCGQAVVTVWTVLVVRVFIIDGGVEREYEGACVEHVRGGGAEPTHYPGSECEGGINPIFWVVIFVIFARNRLAS